MKTLLLVACALTLTASSAFCGDWIQVTVATVWPDGLKSDVGVVERLITENEEAWVIDLPGGKRSIPKAHAKPITDEQAAVALFIQRQSLYSALLEVQQSKGGGDQRTAEDAAYDAALKQSLTRAQIRFPTAFVPGQPLHDAVLKRKEHLEQANPTVFDDPTWPEQICAAVDEAMRNAPKEETEPEPQRLYRKAASQQRQTPQEANEWWQNYQTQKQLNQINRNLQRLQDLQRRR